MNQTKRVLLLLALSLTSFATITCYTSCKKSSSSVDACSTVSCQNGGTCSNGICICPTGYTGTTCQNKATTTLNYKNNAPTSVTLIINGATYTIPYGGSISVTGLYDDQAIAYISANGANSSGGLIGEIVSFSLVRRFPSSGSTNVNIDIPADYFFLQAKNSGSEAVTKFYVNYTLASQSLQLVNLPNNSVTYNTGYFKAFSNSNVRFESATLYWYFNPIPLTFFPNQISTLTLN